MASLADDLISLIGASRVSSTAEDLATHSTDKWFASNPPEVVVHAESTEDVSKVLKYANDHGIPVTPQGSRVGYVGGCVPLRGGIALSLARMNRIVEINIADGVAVVEPGVITGELQAAVRELGWFYPPDPASLKECSLGGNIATNAGGPRCLKYGVTRHYVLGLETVLADGSIVKAGGRCHKNKTGFDLVGLMVGSEGLLGVVTQATLRLIPHPPMRAMLSAGFDTFAEAANAVQRILNAGFLPSALEIADKFTLRAARDYLGESVTPQGDAHLLVEIDGQEESVKGELLTLAKLVRELGCISLEEALGEEACERFWKLRREFSYSLRNTGLIKLNEDIVVPRSRLVDLVEFAEALQLECGFPIASFGHAGDGNIHVNIMVLSMDDPVLRARAEDALDKLFRQVIAWNGAITGEHGIGIAKGRWFPEALSEEARDMHSRLKKALDPKGILNPGKFVA
ncbi:glycolate oxidase [Prosthecobacter fusiformis]|uniref:Glycolate oxidase n=1 Tax=Prosthecobacter fusiformis TaxID=48464 RepID=A0A4R7SRI5_9BACT|nr:FAD-linked oxidase C-terminal domain-containing protein [Prosthecobacter fusiformis]TDU81731.1 glycolate oxidase [Prosthecobacter fusiformis]